MKANPSFLEVFKNPGSDFRGKPFWSWNGKLEKEELLRQVHVLKEMGMGGFFMHSRTGLVTEYLGKEWFELINACAEEGEKLGLEAWLYDEDRWPSGLAGGLVTENPKFRQKLLRLTISEPKDYAPLEGAVAAWFCRLENDYDVFELEKINEPLRALTPAEVKAKQGKKVISFNVELAANNSFFNGYTNLDCLSLEATQEFIRVTHQAYKEHCGHHFGKAIKGIFTDEPNRGPALSGFGINGTRDGMNVLPWTEGIFEKFSTQFKYQVEENLPALFLRLGGAPVSQVKWHYLELLQQLFLNHFAKPCYDFCEQNNLLLTGHVLHENNLACQTSSHGSVQRFYVLMHAPGVDVLTSISREFVIVKQLASGARQNGQKWLLSELYGVTGWHLDFEGHKWLGDWQALYGINLRCHHLSWYTMAGEAKRDYPASILHQSAWYKDYDYVESYYARFGAFMQQGEACCDVLVLTSVESVWTRIYPGAIDFMTATDPGIKKLNEVYAEVFELFAGNQIDFDYGDEAQLAQRGKVIVGPGQESQLELGKAQYRVVVVAGLETIRSTTLTLLTQFQQAGGKVIFAGVEPSYIDALANKKIGAYNHFKHIELTAEAILETITPELNYPISILSEQASEFGHGTTLVRADNVYSQFRKTEEGYHFALLNNRQKESSGKLWITLPVQGEVECFDARSGEVTLLPVAARNMRSLTVTANLPAVGELLLRVVEKSKSKEKMAYEPQGQGLRHLNLPVKYRLAEPNVAVLDTADLSWNGKALFRAKEVLQLDDGLRIHLGVPKRSGHMVQPWMKLKKNKPSPLGKVSVSYPFTCSVLPKSVELALENVGAWSISINGRELTKEIVGTWIDVAFSKLKVPTNLLKLGQNEITLISEFSELSNIEAIYLLGEFGVEATHSYPGLTQLPEKLYMSDVSTQGLPFYGAQIFYLLDEELPEACRGKRCLLKAPHWSGAFLKVHQGKKSAMMAWKPYEVEIELPNKGGFEVEVCLTRRNTFGPLHLTERNPGAIGPGHFKYHEATWSDAPVLIDSGLLGGLEIVPLQA